MFCKNCGAEIEENSRFCAHCGTEVNKKIENSEPIDVKETKTTQSEVEIDEPKTGMGVLMGLFLGLIGLVIGLLLYKENTIARKTFIKGWVVTVVISVIISILSYGLVLGSIWSTMGM